MNKETLTLGVVDIDARGENGGTLHECVIRFKVTDTKEEFLVKATKAFDIVKKNLIKSNF
jgi:hypothetical protein